MADQIEFSKFYNQLKLAKKGEKNQTTELDAILKEYLNGDNCSSIYDQLGKIFCNIAINEVYEYTGLSNIKEICNLTMPVWDYLKKRNGKSLKLGGTQ